MESKTLLTGIICFIAGALLVSVAATTFDKRVMESTAMDTMIRSLDGKSGDEYDQEFISQMILHHQAAVDMAKMSESQAKHDEIKQLSKDIINAQEKEISQMRNWQSEWGYKAQLPTHEKH